MFPFFYDTTKQHDGEVRILVLLQIIKFIEMSEGPADDIPGSIQVTYMPIKNFSAFPKQTASA